MIKQGLSVRQLSHFHATISAARKKSSGRIYMQLGDTLPNVLEETTTRMLGWKWQQQIRHRYAPYLKTTAQCTTPSELINVIHLDVAISRPRGKVLLMWINSNALDCTFVCLESVANGTWPHVYEIDVSLLSGGNQHLMLRCIHKAARTLIMACKCHHQWLAMR